MIVPAAIAQVNFKDRPVTLDSMQQGNHAIALPTREGYTVVVWEDERSGDADIYAQLIDNEHGIAQWLPIDGVSVCVAEGDQRNPRAAYDTLGGVIIVWEDYRDANTLYGTTWNVKVFAQRLTLNDGGMDPNWGAAQDGIEICAYDIGTGNKREPRIVGTGEGAYIAWTDYRDATYSNGVWANSDVYLSYILSDIAVPPTGGSCNWLTGGNPVTRDAADQCHPEIALDNIWRTYSGTGSPIKEGAIIVFDDNRNFSNPLQRQVWNLYVHNIGRDGRLMDSTTGSGIFAQEVPVSASDYDERHAVIASTGGVPGAVNANGVPSLGPVIAWEDLRDSAISASRKCDILTQCVDPENVPIQRWSPDVNLSPTDSAQEKPCIAVLDLVAYVGWEDSRLLSTTGKDIYVNLVDVANIQQGYASGLAVCAATGMQENACIDAYDDGIEHVMLGWQDGRHVGDTNIYYQEYDEDLYLAQAVQNGAPVTAAKSSQFHPLVNRNVYVWEDERRDPMLYDTRNDRNIFAQMIGSECEGPTGMHWREVYAKWTPGTIANHQRITVDGEGSTFIVWDEKRDYNHYGVYAQKLDKDGVPRWKNDGIQLSSLTVDAQSPAVCSDGEGGAYVAWEENDGANAYVVLVRYTAIGGLVQNWSTLAGDEKPELVSAIYSDPVTGQVTYTGEGGYLATINAGDAYVRCFNPSGWVGGSAMTPIGDAASVKITTDYYEGSYAVFANGSELYPLHLNQLYATTNVYQAQNGHIDVPSLQGFDVATDIIVLHIFDDHYYNHDCLICASVAGGVAGNQIQCWRIVQEDPKKAGHRYWFDIPSTSLATLITDGHSSSPAIAADSIPNVYPERMPLGGVLVSWDEYDPNQQLHKVLSNRIRWCYDYVNDTYESGVLYVDGNGDQSHAVIADSCTEPTYPNIARINTVIAYPSMGGDPLPIRYGVTAWTDDRIISCATTKSILAQVLNYTDWNTDPAYAAMLGEVGAVVSPYVGSFEQTGGLVETNLLNTFSLVWSDTRADSANVMTTTMSFDETAMLESRLKRGLEPPIAQTIVSQNVPNPFCASNGTVIPIALSEESSVSLQVYDALGRLVLERDCGVLGIGKHEIPLAGVVVGALHPGVYFYAVSTDMRTSVRSMIVIH